MDTSVHFSYSFIMIIIIIIMNKWKKKPVMLADRLGWVWVYNDTTAYNIWSWMWNGQQY